MRKPFDWTVYPFSRISRLPLGIQGPLLLLRNLIRKNPKPQFIFDGIETCHNMFFLKEPAFVKAQSRAILAGGFDYEIPLRLHQAIWCARYSIKRDSDAYFLEFGTGKGFVMSAVLSYLTLSENRATLPPMLLFDSYQNSATDALSHQSPENGKNIYYADSFDQVLNNFKEWPNVKLVKGILPESLLGKIPEKVSFMHVDLNSPLTEVQCIQACWENLIPGGIILLDDFAYLGFEKSHEILTNFFNQIGYAVLTTATGQGIVIK